MSIWDTLRPQSEADLRKGSEACQSSGNLKKRVHLSAAALSLLQQRGVIIGNRDVIVVDSLSNAAMAQSLMTEIRRLTDKLIRFLINTPSHFDHVYSHHLFPQANACQAKKISTP